jgi:hypothetical protein
VSNIKPIRILTVAIFFVFSGATARAVVDPSSPHVPLAFVENRGQVSPLVRYVGTGPEYKAWFEDRRMILRHGSTQVKVAFVRHASDVNVTPEAVAIIAGNPIGGKANFLLGRDPRRWRTDLPLYSSIRYSGLWPGVELTYKAEDNRLKAEYHVAPGANVEWIRLRFDGDPQIQGDGTLLIQGQLGDFVEDKPVLYQSIGGKRREIAGGFQKLSDGSIGFRTAEYDHNQPLVIDPFINVSGYFGGSSEDNINAIGVDALNNIVTAGWTSSNNLPASNGAQSRYGGSVDAFVASFLPNGGGLNYCTYLGGSGDDQALGLAIDSARNVYITGWTSSMNFPLASAFQIHLGGTRDAFVTKLNAAGNALIFSTYLGGSGVDAGYAIALSPSTSTNAPTNSVVVAGDTTSTNLAVTTGVFQPKSGGSQDAFVAMLSPGGNALTFLTYLGGRGIDHASSVKLGSGGAIFLAGSTWSNNFPVVKAYQPTSGGSQDGFVMKMNPLGTSLLWSTYLGGSGGSVGAPEEVNSLCIDQVGNVVVAGTTSSGNFPVTAGALQTALAGQTDGFITRFTNSVGALLQSTLLGGALSDGINALALDFYGNPYVTGFTSSQDFPVQNPIQNANAGTMDAFVVKLNTTLSSVIFGTYLGGSGSDQGNAIAVDAETSMVVAGQTGSGDFPVTGSLQNWLPSVLSSFITKIRPNFTLGVAFGVAGQMDFTADPWHVASYVASTLYGNATDLPIAGDWNGSGTKGIGVFRNGTWILDTNGNGILDAADKTVSFGQAGDIPVVGDWRGTGHIALGLFRQGTFILDLSGRLSGVPTGLNDATFTFGQGGDIPVVSDWNGSGTTKVGIFRNGLWIVDYTGGRVVSGLNRSYVYGQAGDFPVVGDWDSSGTPPKIGIYRAGLWVLNYTGSNTWVTPGLTEMTITFGFAGYTPLVF